MLDHRFDDTIAAWNVDARFGRSRQADAALLLLGRDRTLLSVRRQAEHPEARWAAAVRLAALDQGQAFRSPGEPWTRAELRAAKLEAARRLMPGAEVAEATTDPDGLSVRRLAWACNVPDEAARLRIADWLGQAPFC